MRTWVICSLLVLVLGPACAGAAEADYLATLKSNASLAEKIEACRVLGQEGTTASIPVLAPLLLDETLSHMARYALEPMPYPEAGAALRDALEKAPNLLKVGIISSLGVRQDDQAVPALAALLADRDGQVAQAAAIALGDIATPQATEALSRALAGNPTAGTAIVVCNALLDCAEDLAGPEATAIYDRLRALEDVPPYITSAALRGAVLTRSGGEQQRVLADALRADEDHVFDMALRVARELQGEAAIVSTVAEALPSLDEDRKLRVIGVFGPGDGAAAGEAVLAELDAPSAGIRLAAIKAVTRMGFEPALAKLEKLAAGDDAMFGDAARNALAYFPGGKGDPAIRAMLGSTDAPTRRVAVQLIGEGALDEPVAPLMEAARGDADPAVQLAALEALVEYAGSEQVPALLDYLRAAPSPDHAEATRTVLAAITERAKRAPGSIVITKATYSSVEDGARADVTEIVQRIFESGAQSIEATNEYLGDPAPDRPKQLQVDYDNQGTNMARTVREGESLKLGPAIAPPGLVDAFRKALGTAEGDAQVALIRLLGATGSPDAYDDVRAVYTSGGAAANDAFRTLCEWPTPAALPFLKESVSSAQDAAQKTAALRGAVRLVAESGLSPAQRVAELDGLMAAATTTGDKLVVLSGVAQMTDRQAFDMALAQIPDDDVRGEAVQTAINVARNLGKAAREDAAFFNGSDLGGWAGNTSYWTVRDGAIVGHSDAAIPQNEFLWSNVDVGDFYLVLDVRLVPNDANAGIQVRSEKADAKGHAKGYQADIGASYWGRLYDEHGRGMLDDSDAAEKAVKVGEWNRYEVLAVGRAIWIAINGTVGTAFVDLHDDAEATGQVALQMHSGPAFTVEYRIDKLVHDPKIELEHQSVDELIPMLRVTGP